MSNLPTSAFKAVKYFLAVKSDLSMPVAWPNSYHSHKKQIVWKHVLIEIFVMLKFTERPKKPGMTSKKTLLSLKGISRFCANLDEIKADMVQFRKRWN